MTVGELYNDAIIYNHYSLELLIRFLVKEKKVLQMEDDSERVTYYLQDRFRVKMNEHLGEFDEKH